MKAVRRALIALCVTALVLAPLAYAAPRNKTWQYTALGDSLAVGAIALRGYVPRYQQYIQTDTGFSVSLRNLAQNGWTSADLLSALNSDENFRSSVQTSQVITWDIGGNDLRHARESYKNGTCGGTDNQDCLRATLDAFVNNWNGIVLQILSIRSSTNTIIRTMDLYNPFVNEDLASDTDGDGTSDFWTLKPYHDAVNNHIRTSASANGIPWANVHDAFNGADGLQDPQDKGYIAFDGVHPNDTGHKVIADQLRLLRYAPLSTR
jgi:lysophospholipase L1-like esterase